MEVQDATGPAGAGGAADEIVDRHRGLVLRTLLVSGLTLGSRLLGFVREMLSAALFGDGSAIYDAFVTAWRVPNLFRRFLGEGAIATSLQTAITEADGDAGLEAGRRLFLETLRVMTVVLVLFCAASIGVFAFLPDRMPITGWSWLGENPEAVREFAVRLMPFLVLVCFQAICAGALQVRGHFTTPYLAPALMNVVWIGVLVWIGARFVWVPEPVSEEDLAGQLAMARVLTWGVLASGVAQVVVQIPALARRGLLRPPPGSAALADAGRATRRTAWTVLRTAAPLALGAAVYQVNVMVDGFMAQAMLREGGPTAHYFANRVEQFPLALIAVAATNAVFPSLKALGHRRRLGELRALHDRAQLAVVFLALPATVALVVLARPIAAVLFQHGMYEADGVARIAAGLRGLALALLPAGAVGLAGRTYYAIGDFRTPVRVSVVALFLNIALNVALVAGLGMDVEGLALGTAFASWVNLLALLPGLRRRLPGGVAGTAGRVGRMLAAALVSGAAALLAHRGAVLVLLPAGTPAADAARSVPALLAAVLAGLLVYAGLAALLGVPEWRDLRRRLARRP